jgi:hypothetical protein
MRLGSVTGLLSKNTLSIGLGSICASGDTDGSAVLDAVLVTVFVGVLTTTSDVAPPDETVEVTFDTRKEALVERSTPSPVSIIATRV